MSGDQVIGRRTFLLGSGAAMTGGLIVTYQLGTRLPPLVAPPTSLPEIPSGPLGTLNVYIHVQPDDTVQLTIPEIELGQGITTALAQILSDELCARWAQIEVRTAPVDADAYGEISTEGSRSIRDNYKALRKMAAAAREMLVTEAAAVWGVRRSECEAVEGRVRHSESERSETFGSLAAGASRQRVPTDPVLRPSGSERLIGKSVEPLDAVAPLRGARTYGLDVRVPRMLFAQVARPPWFGAKLQRWDGAAAKSVPGVVRVVPLGGSVAVLAEHTWAALAGCRALDLVWTEPKAGQLDDGAIARALTGAARQGQAIAEQGDVGGLAGASRSFSADYRAPFLAHGALEPLNCTAHHRGDECELWVGTQRPAQVQRIVAAKTGLSREQVIIHHAAVGGSFGRRTDVDYVLDAVELSKTAGRPVQVVWSRKDDMAGGRYRPAALHRLRAALDRRGFPKIWTHAAASVATEDGAVWPSDFENPYAVPNQRISHGVAEVAVPAGDWRSGAHSHLAFAVECFVDELARRAGQDPIAYRKRLLTDRPRFLKVLQTAAERSGYGARLAAGRAHGVAVYASAGSVVAQVAEVSMSADRPKVHRITCAIDCGRAINPDGVRAQVEGSIAFGLSAALFGQIRIRDGRPQASNYHDYRVLRLREMPAIDVDIVPSEGPLGGAGEPAVPPVAPAVANAVSRLTGRAVRALPLST